MTDSPLTRTRLCVFFDNYLAALLAHRISEKQRRWYVKHVADFIKDQNRRDIKTLSGADIVRHFDMPDRRRGMARPAICAAATGPEIIGPPRSVEYADTREVPVFAFCVRFGVRDTQSGLVYRHDTQPQSTSRAIR